MKKPIALINVKALLNGRKWEELKKKERLEIAGKIAASLKISLEQYNQ